MKKALVLRTCDADMTSRSGFVWPASGPVKCPDWDPKHECGNGLHGALWGEGNGWLFNWKADAVWQVVEVDADSVVDLDGKVKFPRGVVVHTGDQKSATDYIIAHGARGAVIGSSVMSGKYGTATAGDCGTATAGDEGTATAGDFGTATAGDYGTATAGGRGTATAGDFGTATAGDEGTATAGDRGTTTAGDEGTATAGGCGTATAGGRGTATAGDFGTATAGDEGTATAGDRGTATAGDFGTATAGDEGTATAGDFGRLIITHWDGSRSRVAVGYVGENGIKSNTPYKLDKNGKFVEASK